MALGIENGERKSVSIETVSSGKQRKCRDKKVLSVNAVLSLYHRMLVGMFLWEGPGLGRSRLGILPVTTADF